MTARRKSEAIEKEVEVGCVPGTPFVRTKIVRLHKHCPYAAAQGTPPQIMPRHDLRSYAPPGFVAPRVASTGNLLAMLTATRR